MKVTVLPKKWLNTGDKSEIYSHRKKFRQINYLLLYLVICSLKMLVSRKFCQNRVRVNFRNFHTVHSTLTVKSEQKQRQYNLKFRENVRKNEKKENFYFEASG